MAQYRFLAADILTNQVYAELPLKNSSFQSLLNDSGTWSGELLLTDPRASAIDWQTAAQPGRIVVYVERDGRLVYAGIVWQTSYTRSTFTLQLSGNDLWSYFLNQRPAFNNSATGWTYTNADMFSIVEQQINYAQSFPNGNIGVNVPTTTCGQTIDFQIQNSQLISVGQVVADMATGVSLNSGTADRTSLADGVTTAASGIVTSASANFGSYSGDLGGPISGGSIPQNATIGTINSSSSITLANGALAQSNATGLVLSIAQAPIQTAGFDFGIDVQYDSNLNFQKNLTLSFPRRGRTFATSGVLIDLQDVLDYTWQAQAPANLIRATGSGAGSNQLTSSVSTNPLSFPLLAATLSTSNAVTQRVLDGRAQALLAALENGPTLPTVTIMASSDMAPFGSYIVGDSIRIIGTDEFFTRLDQIQRLVGLTLHPNDDGLDTVDLTFNNMPTFI